MRKYRPLGAFAPLLLLLAAAACVPAGGPGPVISGAPGPGCYSLDPCAPPSPVAAQTTRVVVPFPIQPQATVESAIINYRHPPRVAVPNECCVSAAPRVAYQPRVQPQRQAHRPPPPRARCPGMCPDGQPAQWQPTIDCRAAGGTRTINPRTGAPSCFVPGKNT